MNGNLRVTGAVETFSICEIQGEGRISPYVGRQVRTMGVVTADLDERKQQGFFIQTNSCDHSDLASEAVFVYLDEYTDLVSSGDLVDITGVVHEYHGLTEIQPVADRIIILSSGNGLPSAVDLSPPLDNETALNYFESLEGMLVQMQSATVVGPSDRDGHIWVVRSDLEIERVFDDDPQGTGEVISIGDAGLVSLNAGAKVSDQISAVYGVLTEEDTVYPVQLLSPPLIIPGELPANDQDVAGDTEFSLATVNLHNLFDTYDDPNSADEIYTSVEYQRRLNKLALAIHGPLNETDLLVVQEAENDGVLRDLALRPEIITEYDILWVDTPDPRGQDTALLYRPDKFAVLDYQTQQGCTALVDGLGPDGNQDVAHPSNSVTCDRDGDGALDGNRLFSRPVLVVHLQAFNAPGRDDAPIELILVINHWKSKTEDTPENSYTLSRRLEEAEFVAWLVKDLISRYPAAALVIAGDLNDVPGSEPVKKLDIPGLLDLTAWVEKSRRYSLIYQGVSQVFDYILVKPTIYLNASHASFQHINSDYPAGFESVAGTEQRSSDHDPLVVSFVRFTRYSYLPMIHLGK